MDEPKVEPEGPLRTYVTEARVQVQSVVDPVIGDYPQQAQTYIQNGIKFAQGKSINVSASTTTMFIIFLEQILLSCCKTKRTRLLGLHS